MPQRAAPSDRSILVQQDAPRRGLRVRLEERLPCARRANPLCPGKATLREPAGQLPLVQQPFALFDHLAFTPRGDEDENVVVALSPAGAAVFRAWLRQRGLDPLVCSS